MKIRKSTAKNSVIMVGLMAAVFFMTWQCEAQNVVYCKNGQTGKVIVIEAGYACPYGYYRI